MSHPPDPAVAATMQRLRSRDLAGARSAAEAGLAARPDDPALLELAGLTAAESGDPRAAAGHFRRLLDLAPGHRAARTNLATALLAAGDLDEAGRLAEGSDTPRLARIAGYVHQQRGRPAEAAAAYETVVAAMPQDFESWNNLGNARAAIGDLDGAIDALGQALRLRPDLVRISINLSEVLAAAEREGDRQRLMREAARIAPGDPDVLGELGLAEAAARDFEAAERAFREAIRISPGFTQSWLELGLLLENLNRVDDLVALAAEADARGFDEAELGFLKAWALRRQGRFAEAMPLAEQVPPTINPIRRAQLLAELADRLGDAPRAFAAFEEMNAAALAAKPAPPGPTYRERIAADAAMTSAEWVRSWTPAAVPPSERPPVFIVGFPRSGTTLLDTLLMNVPDLHVLEELPAFPIVEAEIGGQQALPALDEAAILRLRAHYFEAVEELLPCPPGKRIVDKHPLHMARMPAIHRLFPETRIVLVERHPCDAVLSCFMANFTLNHAMRSFTDLVEAARTYDAVFTAWTRAEALLPLRVHRVRYERMVEDLEAELRPLLDFLGIAWDDKVLDNRGSAARRDHIRTASYSQVTEPIYRRAAGRWERYRAQLEPVLPILAPWAERLGYPI